MTRRARTAAGAGPAGFRDRPFPASVPRLPPPASRLIVDDHGGDSGRGGERTDRTDRSSQPVPARGRGEPEPYRS
ncbi:hypothetical protein ACWGNE_05745 [Streptomyces xiamenensis]